jgi:hypothetical protein
LLPLLVLSVYGTVEGFAKLFAGRRGFQFALETLVLLDRNNVFLTKSE